MFAMRAYWLLDLFNQMVVSVLPLFPKPLVRIFASRYVAGETQDEMLASVQNCNTIDMHATVDVLGEFITDLSQARDTAREYHEIILKLRKHNTKSGVSIKLTALGLLLDKQECLNLMIELCETAKLNDMFIRIDMEDSACTDDTIDIYLTLRKTYANVGIVLQAYLHRTLDDVKRITAAGAGNFRICKGIYIEPKAIAYQNDTGIHKNFKELITYLLENKIFIGIATHHKELVSYAWDEIDRLKCSPQDYEFQMLLGVEADLRDEIVRRGHRMRIYVPYGKDWYAYSMRRFKENPRIVSHVIKNLFTRGH